MADTSFTDIATAVRSALNVALITASVPQTRVYSDSPPRSATFPYIKIRQQADSRDVHTLGDSVYQFWYISVTVVHSDPGTADTILKNINSILNRGSLTIGSPNRHGVTKKVGYTRFFEDSDNGNSYLNAGAIYEIGVGV
jgi:hypothetical protein